MPDRFNIVKKGYDPAAVDQYINHLEAELKSHRDKSGVINQAIVSAQQAADNIILNAKNQGRAMKEDTSRQLGEIAASVHAQRQLLNDFVREYNATVSKYLNAMDSQDLKMVSGKIDALETFLHSFAEEVKDDLQVEKKKEAVDGENDKKDKHNKNKK